MVVRHAPEHVFEVGARLDVVEPCRGDEGADRASSLCAAMGVVTRVMGMVLAAIAMGMLADGLKAMLPGLAGRSTCQL